MKKIIFFVIALVHSFTAFTQTDSIAKKTIHLKIKPSLTDATIKVSDSSHLVMYYPSSTQGKLFLFLPGTNGIPEKGPMKLFITAIQQGYRVINLSYINTPAVAAICKGEILTNDIDCTEKFRTKRIFGTNTTSMISDEPQDAIINRFTKLLIYLNEFDKQGNWGIYLENGAPKWSEITLTGQSQGGGMAAFIAKEYLVAKVITFSGGWDYSAKNNIAKWYFKKSVTPPERWYGTYHIAEPKAKTLDETYKAMNIPINHIYALDLGIRKGKKAHGEAIRNTVYKKQWIEMFGTGY